MKESAIKIRGNDFNTNFTKRPQVGFQKRPRGPFTSSPGWETEKKEERPWTADILPETNGKADVFPKISGEWAFTISCGESTAIFSLSNNKLATKLFELLEKQNFSAYETEHRYDVEDEYSGIPSDFDWLESFFEKETGSDCKSHNVNFFLQ